MRFTFIFSAVHHLAVIKSLINNYVDLKMASIEMAESVRDYEIVDIRDNINNKTMQAKVDMLDYRLVTDKQYRWRLHSSGYAVSSKGKKSTFMHSLIFGAMASHINGDRLDNRRSNLVTSKRSKVRADEEIEIRGPRALHEYSSKDKWLIMEMGKAVVRYDDEKIYTGSLQYGIPHGPGVLTSESPSYDIVGMWKRGKIDTGLQINYKEGCLCEHFQLCPLRNVIDVELIKSGFKLRPDPDQDQGQCQDGQTQSH